MIQPVMVCLDAVPDGYLKLRQDWTWETGARHSIDRGCDQ